MTDLDHIEHLVALHNAGFTCNPQMYHRVSLCMCPENRLYFYVLTNICNAGTTEPELVGILVEEQYFPSYVKHSVGSSPILEGLNPLW